MDGSQNNYFDKHAVEYFLNTRSVTLELVKNLSAEDMVVQPRDFVSPIKWHLGHTTWFFEKFILIPFHKKYKSFSKDFNFIFNSYYNSAGPFNSRDKRGFLNRPLLDDVLKYRKYVDENLFDFFSKDKSKSTRFLLELGINHEQQHQELILMDIKNIFFSNPLKPKFNTLVNSKSKIKCKNDFVLKNNKEFIYGCDQKAFFYDNESPANSCQVEPIKLGSYVTNLDWKNFIKDGGYKSHQYWLSDGWDFIEKNYIDKPLYWIDQSHQFTLNGVIKIDDYLPVSHISFYEACAFAKYKNQRLPTEFEVEYFLGNCQLKGNFLEQRNFSEVDYCESTYKNCLFGNLWLWTSSNYVPYKNYKPYKSELMEYNSKFMCNQFVLKGGSFGTASKHIRSSYRNFYYPFNRWQFCGLRLVEDF